MCSSVGVGVRGPGPGSGPGPVPSVVGVGRIVQPVVIYNSAPILTTHNSSPA